jgi:hypothetical protein
MLGKTEQTGLVIPTPPGFDVLFFCMGLEHLRFPLELAMPEDGRYLLPRLPDRPVGSAVMCLMTAWKLSSPRFDSRYKSKTDACRTTVGFVLTRAIEGAAGIKEMKKTKVFSMYGAMNPAIMARLCVYMGWFPVPDEKFADRMISNNATLLQSTDSKRPEKREPILELPRPVKKFKKEE